MSHSSKSIELKEEVRETSDCHLVISKGDNLDLWLALEVGRGNVVEGGQSCRTEPLIWHCIWADGVGIQLNYRTSAADQELHFAMWELLPYPNLPHSRWVWKSYNPRGIPASYHEAAYESHRLRITSQAHCFKILPLSCWFTIPELWWIKQWDSQQAWEVSDFPSSYLWLLPSCHILLCPRSRMMAHQIPIQEFTSAYILSDYIPS